MPQSRNSSRSSASAAQYSHWLLSSPPRRESYSGEPSVIESPRAATTIRSAPWIGLLCNLRGLAFALADDVVAVALLDDVLHLGNLVSRVDGKMRRLRAHLFVLRSAQRDLLHACRVAALADEGQ